MYYNDCAVLIHGYTLETLYKTGLKNRQWRHIVWGDPDKNLLGRVPKGILLALKQKAIKIIFGTGSSWIKNEKTGSRQEWIKEGHPTDVTFEGDFTLQFLFEHFHELTRFSELEKMFIKMGGIKEAREFVRRVSVTENESHNTATEIRNVLKKCQKFQLISDIFLVTNPSHTPRCDATMKKILQEERHRFQNIFSVSCDTDFTEIGEEPFVCEPHSGPAPRPELLPLDVFPNIFKVPLEKRVQCLKEIKDVLIKYSS